MVQQTLAKIQNGVRETSLPKDFIQIGCLPAREISFSHSNAQVDIAVGGGDYDHLSLRIDFLTGVLERLEFTVEKKGDLLEAKLLGLTSTVMQHNLDMLGRLLGASKLMDMVLSEDGCESAAY